MSEIVAQIPGVVALLGAAVLAWLAGRWFIRGLIGGSIRRARRMIGDGRLLAFFRAVRGDEQVVAVRLVNEALDREEAIGRVLGGHADGSFRLAARRLSPRSFRIEFACVAGRGAGDGGQWDVAFDDSGRVASVVRNAAWVT